MGKGEKTAREKGKQASAARAAAILASKSATSSIPVVGFGG
jgi:molybdenum cofactor biosynthesis enzyme